MLNKYGRGRDDIGAALSGVDQRLRECLQYLWMSLPKERANLEELECQFKRLSERALRDFREDAQQFTTGDDQGRSQEGSLL